MNSFTKSKAHRLVVCMGLAFTAISVTPTSFAFQTSLPEQALEHIPEGRLKQSLSNLPANVQQKVLDKLSALGVPAIDMLLMQADDTGEVFYVEEGLAESTVMTSAGDPTAVVLPPVDVFNLNSKPGSPNTLFLDFDGGLISGTAWGSTNYDAVPYDLDGNPLSFNDTERYRIHEIWTRIADDFAAFDVNVTTKAPSSFGPSTGWLLFTKDTDGNGVAMPHQGAGGVAYVGVWGRSNFTYYQPALVYYNRLGSGTSSYMAEAGSHEVGHNLGLSHDGTSTQGYYAGLGADSEPSSWAPIMGVGYYKNVTQWSRGEYPDANQLQDDIAIITGKLGASADTEGNSSSPVPLVLDSNGQFAATNRQVDPGSVYTENKGAVQVSDSDWFQFDAGAGPAEFHATPAWDAFTRSTRRGSNLDIGIRLYDSAGTLLASSGDDSNTNASILVNLSAGLHKLEVFGTAGPYVSDYGSQGHFYLNGQVSVASPDTIPPDPNPMSFAVNPNALSENQISMQAVVAVDDRGGAVSYQFTCDQSSSGCNDSGWQSNTVYVATGLTAETTYCFTVQARDLSGNVTVASASQCATTPAAPPQPEPPLAPSSLVVSDGQNGSAVLSWSDNSDNENSFDVQREFLHKSGRWQGNTTIASVGANTATYTDVSGTGTFRYSVRAVNAVAASSWTPWVEVTVTGSGGNGGGGDKPCKGKKCSN